MLASSSCSKVLDGASENVSRWLVRVGVVAGVAGACIAGLAAWSWFTERPAAYGTARASAVFRDCEACPDMLPIRAGRFEMGTPRRIYRTLELLGIEAGPRRRVTVGRRFAIGRTEVTFDQWAACVAAGGCENYEPPDEGWGRSDHPVIHVSWNHAQGYVRWLSQITGQAYRLPTEAEWEYAAKAGARTPYAWGRFADHDRANFGGPECPPCTGVVAGTDVWPNTAPVARFPPNAFGLHDMHGNVYEWVQDCYTATLPAGEHGADPILADPCEHRVMRGGAWYSDPHRITSVYRAYNPPDWKDRVIGFRVARSM